MQIKLPKSLRIVALKNWHSYKKVTKSDSTVTNIFRFTAIVSKRHQISTAHRKFLTTSLSPEAGGQGMDWLGR